MTLLGVSAVNGPTDGSNSSYGVVSIGDGVIATNVSSSGNFGSIHRLAEFNVNPFSVFTLSNGNSLAANSISIGGIAHLNDLSVGNINILTGGYLDTGSLGVINGSITLAGTLQNNGLIDGTVSINPLMVANLTNNNVLTTASSGGKAIENYGQINTLNNSGLVGGDFAISNGFIDPGSISANFSTPYLIWTAAGEVTSLVNTGSIFSGAGIGISNAASMPSIVNSNNGMIGGGLYGILNTGAIASIANERGALIGSTGYSGIVNGYGVDYFDSSITYRGVIDTIRNDGVILGTTDTSAGVDRFYNSAGIQNTSEIGSIYNNGLVAGFIAGIENGSLQLLDPLDPNSLVIDQSGTIANIVNTGVIGQDPATSGAAAGGILNLGVITKVDNIGSSALIGGNDMSSGIWNFGTIATINNGPGASISGFQAGIVNISAADYFLVTPTPAYIGAINNAGTISASSSGGYGIANFGTIFEINNTGSIIGAPGSADIGNSGVINRLNNAQGNLIYDGKLPETYNDILGADASTFGKLVVQNAAAWNGSSGTTAFGIYGGLVKSNRYLGIISGVSSSLLNTASLAGNYGGYAWVLTDEATPGIWDLLFPLFVTGPSAADTQQSLVNTAAALQSTYTLQNSVLANSLSYDCTVFGANDVCVSAGGRNTSVSSANGLNNTSGLLIAAYRALPSVRVGAYADQNLSVNNGGSTVNLGNNTPLLGLFAAWNERQDGTGSELKVSAAYGQKNTTINRGVVGAGPTASEAGSGSSQLNSQGFQLVGKHGFSVVQDVVVSPYAGVRYTQNNMGGYTEGASSSVTTPLTYSALNTNATTALAGVGASYRGIPKTNLFASAGIESDTNTANGSYNATWSGSGTLSPVNFNANPVKNRATATLGATYDVEKNQRLGVTGVYRQESYQAVSTTTVIATYTVGF